MMKAKIIVSFLVVGFAFLIICTEGYAHSGRTDGSGCHTNHSTGVYHCHNGSSDSSSSNPVRKSTPEPKRDKDVDHNFVNDYEQDQEELLLNLNNLGGSDGFLAAETGVNQLKPKTSEFTNAEYNAYKKGYEEAYKIKKFEMIKDEASKVGYALGEGTDNLVLPAKYNQPELIEAFERGFNNALNTKWGNIAYETAKQFKDFNLPTDLPQNVKDYARLRYNAEIKVQEEIAFTKGYTYGLERDKIKFPSEIEKSNTLKKAFEKGFKQSKEESNNESEEENSSVEEIGVLYLTFEQVITPLLLLCLLIPFILFFYIYKEETKEKIQNLRNKF
jgi:hypothetical protein